MPAIPARRFANVALAHAHRTPRDFMRDTFVLECGHTTTGFESSENKPKQCQDCIEEWLLGQAKPKKKKSSKK